MKAHKLENQPMKTIIFDTLQYAKRAEKAGFTETQAEFQAEEMAKIIEEQLVTKRDLTDVETKLINRIDTLDKDLRHEINKLENKLLLKLGTMIGGFITVLLLIIKVFHL